MENDVEVIKKNFKEIIQELLFPLFPGVQFGENVWVDPPKVIKEKLVAQKNPSTLNLTFPLNKKIRCQIKRNQSFTEGERGIVEKFLINIERVFKDWGTPYSKDTSSSFMSMVVASSTSDEHGDFLLRVISVMTDWAQQTYEGQRISFSLGISSEKIEGQVCFDDMCDNDFFKVISNAYDSIVIFNSNKKLVEHKRIKIPDDSSDLFSPVRFVNFAGWTKEHGGVVVILNRNGEILIFKNGSLFFAKRRGTWRYFAHESVIKRLTANALGRKTSESLRKEIYLTALDVSFARTGGCIGVATASNKKKLLESKLIAQDDLINGNESGIKAKSIFSMIKNSKFQDIDRLLRLELVSIDGATIIDFEGNILTAGAILSISGGSSGGGRQAATSAIAKFGLGIKISNDGYIKAFDRDQIEMITLS